MKRTSFVFRVENAFRFWYDYIMGKFSSGETEMTENENIGMRKAGAGLKQRRG